MQPYVELVWRLVVVGGDLGHLAELRAKEEQLVERARQLSDKEEALESLERQLLAKQEALYWREQCLHSEHLTTPTTSSTPAMPPLIQIRPGFVGMDQRGMLGMGRRPRVTVMYLSLIHI